MNNSIVAHLWAHEQEESASGSNFFFEGTSIYSYGHHFEVGRIVKNKQGKKAYLINEDYYSATTSKHQCYVRNAIPTWAMVFSVKEDDYFPFSSTDVVGYEYKLLYHEKFFEHLHMKRLVIDENIPFPVSTWERSYRYKGYGYNMCRETKKKLLQAIKGVNVEEEDVSLYTTGGWD
jgi:hypothetical protein